MTETQERFLRYIAERVPLDRVVEVHLFPAIRQGGVETGIAVIAARPEDVEPAQGAVDGPPHGAPERADALAALEAEDAAPPVEATTCDPTEDAAGPAPEAAAEDGAGGPPQLHDEAEPAGEQHHAVADLASALREPAADLPLPVVAAVPADDGGAVDEGMDASAEDDPRLAADRAVPIAVVAADRADDRAASTEGGDAADAVTAVGGIAHEMVAALIGSGDDAPAPSTDGVAAEAVRQEEARHTIFSARYRLTLRGADRGKWEFDVVAEADAPLVAVDAVVRGVRQRSGEQSDAERVSVEALRRLAVVRA
jgi:hypothetical protein